MRKLASLVVVAALAASATGCVVRTRGHVNPVASVLWTGIAVAAVANAVAVSTPPPATVDVGYYGEYRPGYVWVNGYHRWSGNAYVWTPGYYQAARQNQVWVQGYWEPRGSQYVWVDGYWASQRQGYVYVDGYYDYAGSGYVWRPGRWETQRAGHVWVQGSWSSSGSRRTWNQGYWQPAAAPAPVRASARANGGVLVTPR